MKYRKIFFLTLPLLLTVLIFILWITKKTIKPFQGLEEERIVAMEEKTVASQVQRTGLQEKMENYIKTEEKLAGAIAGISIRDAENGEILAAHHGDTRLHPASNMKLLTAAAALSILGEAYTFPTEIRYDGKLAENKLHGNLYIKGKGDPTLLPEDFEKIAKEIAKSGIEKVDGNIIADDYWYDHVRLSQDLIWTDEHYYYGSQVSALSASPNEDYDSGTIIVTVKPGKTIGDKPTVSITPDTDYVKIHNEAITKADGSEEDLIIEREHGTNTIIIKGSMPATMEMVREWIAVWEPTGYALDLFTQALAKNGITWKKAVTGETPANAKVLLTNESMPLKQLLVPFMKLSNNGHGEILIKEMGKVVHGEGSWEKGLEVLMDELEKLGIKTETLMIRDGSGISHVNLIPPNEISKLLYHVQAKPWFPAFLDSLPEGGNEERMVGGTLRNRLHGMNVQAKTGTINGVSTLSGYAETKSGKNVIFAIMLNNILDEDDGPEIEDNLVEIIVNEL